MKKLILGLALSGLAAASAPSWSDDLEARGLVQPTTEAVISSEIGARITRLPFKDGHKFEKGAVLVGFDCRAFQAELNAALATLEGAKKTFENASRLAQLNATGELEVAIAQADMDKAAAEAQLARIRVGRCNIRAPYEGVVVDLQANPHEAVGPQTELMKILAIDDPEIELIVPSDWLNFLSLDTGFEFVIDETGQRYGAQLLRIGAEVDAVSKTIRVVGAFIDAPADLIVPGMSGTALFSAP